MFYKKTLTPRKVKNFKVKFDAFDKPPEPSKIQRGKASNLASECYNFRVENGALQTGYGFKDLALPLYYHDLTESTITFPCDEIKKIWSFRWFDYMARITDSYIFFLGGDNHIYMTLEYRVLEGYDPIDDTAIVVTSDPATFSYRLNGIYMFVVTTPTDDLFIYAGGDTPYVFENMPKFVDTCVHENVLYGILSTDDTKIVYTKDLKFPNMEETEFSELVFLGGEGYALRKLFSLNDYVYIFRDNGIVRVYPYGTSATLSMSHVYYSSSYIMPETIQRCGDEIIYLTREGLYSFNGNTSEKIDLEITDKIDTSCHANFVSANQKDKYFLACKMDFDDGEEVLCEGSEQGFKNNAVLIYDVESKCVEIMRGLDVRDFEPFESHSMSKMLCCFYNDNKGRMGELTTDGKMFGQIMPQKWTSVKTDFGYSGQQKVIKSVELCAQKNCSLQIETEQGKKTFQIDGCDKLQKIKLGEKGEWFKISFLSNEEEQKISSVEFDIDLLL